MIIVGLSIACFDDESGEGDSDGDSDSDVISHLEGFGKCRNFHRTVDWLSVTAGICPVCGTRPGFHQIPAIRGKLHANKRAQTLSFNGKICEVPGAYIRQKIEIRHPVDAPDERCLYDNGARIAKLKLVDAGENVRRFRSQKRSAMSKTT